MVDDISMCSMRTHSKWLAELGHCSSLPPHLKLSVVVDEISICSVRAHLKWSLRFTPQVYCQSHLQIYCQSHLTLYCQSHLQVYYQCHLQVYCHSHLHIYPPFETVSAGRWSIYVFSESHLKWLARFTPQVYYQCHLQVYCHSHIQVYPPIWNCHWWQIKYWLIYGIYVCSESPFKTAQVYSSSLLLKFTP